MRIILVVMLVLIPFFAPSVNAQAEVPVAPERVDIYIYPYVVEAQVFELFTVNVSTQTNIFSETKIVVLENWEYLGLWGVPQSSITRNDCVIGLSMECQIWWEQTAQTSVYLALSGTPVAGWQVVARTVSLTPIAGWIWAYSSRSLLPIVIRQ